SGEIRRPSDSSHTTAGRRCISRPSSAIRRPSRRFSTREQTCSRSLETARATCPSMLRPPARAPTGARPSCGCSSRAAPRSTAAARRAATRRCTRRPSTAMWRSGAHSWETAPTAGRARGQRNGARDRQPEGPRRGREAPPRMSGMPLILDEEAVRSLLRMDELIPAMATALADLSRGKVVQPMRVMMPVGEQGGFLGLMPAYGGALGPKLVPFYPNNQGFPTPHALFLLSRPETGEPLVTMDGRLITETRTAAVSAVATKLLARPDASVLAILGSGVQARSHLEAMRLVRAFRESRVWSPRNARAFARQFGVQAADSAAEAVRGADVVVVATTSQVPVLRGEWLSPGTHINAVGAPRPSWRELDDKVLRAARI